MTWSRVGWTGCVQDGAGVLRKAPSPGLAGHGCSPGAGARTKVKPMEKVIISLIDN